MRPRYRPSLPVTLSAIVVVLAGALGLYKRRAVKSLSDQMGATLTTITESEIMASPEFVDQAVSDNPVLIFSKTFCPYSTKAKRAVTEAGSKVVGFVEPFVVEINQRLDGRELQEALYKKTGRRTIPLVFVGGLFVGGAEDVLRLHESSVLSQMIRLALERPDDMRTSLESFTSDLSRSQSARDAQAEMSPRVTIEEEVATFGAGCFWGVELAFQREKGVTRTEVGFSNGQYGPVSYNDVVGGKSGHAEVVRVWFNPVETSFANLIKLWESRHDPTSLNKQGNDRGRQYRSAIFYHDESQRDEALLWKSEAQARYTSTIVTEIAPVSLYNAAEIVHQRFLEKRGQSAEKGDTAAIRCYG